MMIKTCKWCGKEFETDLYWWNFCCEDCHDAFKNYKDNELRNCVICGKAYHPNRANQKYCSPECYEEGQRRNARLKYLKNKDKYIQRANQWAKDHKEEHNKKWMKYYWKNHEKELERKKKYRRDNKEKLNAYSREYNRTHKEEIKIRKCSKKHDNCLNCPTLDGECLFD